MVRRAEPLAGTRATGRLPPLRQTTWIRAALAVGSVVAVFLALAPSDEPVLAASGTLYVDGSSSNCTDGGTGSPSQPYCTIGKAAQLAQAGDTVAVSGGSYTGTAVNPTYSGASGSPITFTASPGVTISGGVEAFAISSRSYIVINGFTITSTASYGIAVSSSSHITISNNKVTGAGQRAKGFTAAGISLSGTTSSLVTHNISDNNSDHGIYIRGASANNTVSFNEASFNAEGWQRNANGINVIESGSTGNTLLGNVVHNNEDSGLQFFSGANNALAIENVSYNNGDHGIDDYNVTGGRLIGNTIYHNCTDGINVEGTSGNYTIMNNISVDNAVYPAYNGISCNRRTGDIGIYDSAPATTTVDYNFVYLTTSGNLYVWANTAYSSPAALYSATGQEAHGIQADPKWVSWTSPNFRLDSGSAAIDSANSGAPGESTVDADGNLRVDDPSTPNTGAGPRAYDDRGAYEFQTIDTQAPSVPTGLAASAPSQNQVNLTWNASTDNVGVAGYTVYRNGAQLAVVISPGYTDGSVSASTTYSYTLDAFDFANNHSAQSSPVSVTTPAPDTQAPTLPTGLTAPAAGATSVSLAWNASTDNVGVTGYTVYRNGSQLATVSGSTLTYTDTTVAAATSYSYTVDAFDAAGNHSAQSAPATVTTPAGDTTPPTTPTGLVANAPSPTQVNLAWNASTDNVGVTGYTVYRNGATLATVGGATLTYTDTAVAPATSYSYTIDAFDAAGNHSAQPAPVSVHVPGQPKFVQGKTFSTGSRVTSTTVTLGAVSKGDLLVGLFGQYDSPGQVSVSDNVNGAWTPSASITWSSTAGDVALYYFANSAAAPAGLIITITATKATYLQGGPAEYSGVATVNPLDQVVIAKGNGTSADSGLTAATGSGELVYGAMVATSSAGTLIPGTSQGATFVKRAQSTSGTQGEEDIVTSAAGQQHAGFTFTNSVPWFMVCALLKPA